MLVAAFLGLIVLSSIVRGCSSGTSTVPAQSTPSSGAESAGPPPPPAPPDPAALLAESTETVDQVEARLKENSEWLKKFYGTAGQVKEATADLVKLAVIKGLYGESKLQAEKRLSARADAVIARVSQQQRVIYASTMEEVFVKNGMDIRVSAGGSKKDQLRLKYVLMSKPLVYKFQNEMNIGEQARAFGFKKIVFSDGYDETWTVDL